jgi:hypothetical protein
MLLLILNAHYEAVDFVLPRGECRRLIDTCEGDRDQPLCSTLLQRTGPLAFVARARWCVAGFDLTMHLFVFFKHSLLRWHARRPAAHQNARLMFLRLYRIDQHAIWNDKSVRLLP